MEAAKCLMKKLHDLRGYHAITSGEDEHRPLTEVVSWKRRDHPLSAAANLSIFFLCLLMFWAGYTAREWYETPTTLEGAAPRVIVSSSTCQQVRHNLDFEAPPPNSNAREPVWDSLIPNGLGYVKHPTLAPNVSVISVFHQLHCLYLLRRAYYSTMNDGEIFDFGIERTAHIGHCFDYVRQGIICSADSTLEPAVDKVNGNPNWGFQRQCRSFDEVRDWARTWRVFDAQGFIPEMPTAIDDSFPPGLSSLKGSPR